MPPPGASPGTLAIPPGSPPPVLYAIDYDADGLVERTVADLAELAAVRDAAAAAGRRLWVDVRGLGDEALLRGVAALFDVGELALEDAVNVPQRAASRLYQRHHALIACMPALGAAGAIAAPQVGILIGEGHLLTFQERFFGFFEPVRQRLRDGRGPIRASGPAHLAYALLDTLVDHFWPIVQALAEEIEELEDEVMERPGADVLTRVHRVRRRLVVIRRLGLPQREAIASLLRDPTPFVDDGVRLYLRDTLHHAEQILELVDSSREMCVALMEIHLSNVSQRTNEVMKVLTILSSIFIPATFLAGIYGMNLEHMPGLHARDAFVVLLGGMAAMALGMLFWFRRRGWLGGARTGERDRDAQDDADTTHR